MRRWLGGIVLVAMVAACSGGAGGSLEPAVSQGSGASPDASPSQGASPAASASASQAASPAASPSSGGGGGSEAPDPCALLTPSEIEAGLGAPVKDGVAGTFETLATCQWVGQDEFSGIEVNLTLEPYDDDTWQEWLTMGGSGDPTIALPGIGDETIRVGGAIYGGTIVVHVGDWTAVFDATSVLLGDDAIDAASRTFAELIAGRM
jgi:hypothetical protein